MRALLIKESGLLLLFLAVGLTVCTSLVFGQGYRDTFVTPENRYFSELSLVWGLLGLLYGWIVGAIEGMRGAEDYLYHRPLSAARIHWYRLAWHVLAVLAVMFLPFVALYVVGSSPFEASFWEMGGPKLAGSSWMLASFGVGFLGANLPLHFAWRLALTAFPFTLWVLGPDMDRGIKQEIASSATLFFSKNWFVAGITLLAGWHAFVAGSDRDRPIGPMLVLPIALLLVATGWSSHLLLNLAAEELAKSSRAVYLGQSQDGSIHPVRRVYDTDRNESRMYQLDPKSHARLIEDPSLRRLGQWDGTGSRIRTASARRVSSSFLEASPLWHLEAFAHAPTGFMRHYLVSKDQRGSVVVLGRPEGAFSAQAELLAKAREPWDATTVVGDPSDGTIWLCDWNDPKPAYQQVDSVDRFLRWIGMYGSLEDRVIQSMREESGQTSAEVPTTWAFFQTDQGFGWLDVRQRRTGTISPEAVAWIQDEFALTPPSGPFVSRTNRSLLFPAYEVRDPQGNVLYRYAWEPRTRTEQVAYAGQLALSWWRSPLVAPIAFANPNSMVAVPDGEPNPVLPDAWLSPRSLPHGVVSWTAWSLWSLPAWGFLVGLALVTRRYLTGLGAQGPRLWLWPVAILAFGIPAALAMRLFETRRAYRSPALLRPEEVPPMWIRSVG
ncbi:MAG TPA: hypothetical protein PLJ12_04240 [Planctomycetota bacterium]|nr:hypothetical protein [Planctomycetota bacterium]